ncbi:adenosylcobinamide-GDP ribazoletransferase [Actinokineospora sp. NBRC 105648]|uniref:adenosylcobinamide-GDP ribazoletransferase n=1 Tax=Actinokineospora sp. NBRC 105648 TaxID=3032206 RepID=UPI0024A1AC80|nr:hypothetical protein Acsp05_62930 [Actinokineospora sp. NBRC 105648]
MALSWLTVLPIRVSDADAVDPRNTRRAITLAPLVGLLLGFAAVGVLFGAHLLGLPALLGGVLTVGFLALATRGMHLDGLADTADGLGCYGPPERALEVMRSGGAGPFGVVTLLVVLGAQAVSYAALVPQRWGAVVLAIVAGRAAFTACCVRGVPAARPSGLGALVADSQPPWIPAAWLTILLGVSTLVVPGHWWLGPTGVAIAALVVLTLTRHTQKRFGGITGDVLGATSELTTATILIACTATL